MEILASKSFLKSLRKLDSEPFSKALSMLNKLQSGCDRKGLNVEDLNCNGFCSARIDDNFRAIYTEEPGARMVFRYAAAHESAYRWVCRHKAVACDETDRVCIVPFSEDVAIVDYHDRASLAALSDEDLAYFGVPAELIDYARSLQSAEDVGRDTTLPERARELLIFFFDLEIPRYEVFDMARSNDEDVRLVGDDYGISINSEAELRDALDATIEEWRMFLHPRQAAIVQKNYKGPVHVVGEAGTGKTVVAMHRARRLANELEDGERLLVTTFNKGLADYLKKNLEMMCSEDAMAKIDVMTMDVLASAILKSARGSKLDLLVRENERKSGWKNAIKRSSYKGKRDEEFFMEECEKVLAPNAVTTLDEYLKVSRKGRGVGLSKDQRKALWPVIETYLSIYQHKGSVDLDYAAVFAKEYLDAHPKEASHRYRYVVVDEAQDLRASSLRLLRSVAGDERENDLFIVGDAHQRIYGRKPTLHGCGINVSGRKERLFLNYRTTSEIARFAKRLLAGASYDGLDGAAEETRSESITHGPDPVVKVFGSAEEEAEFIAREIGELTEAGIEPHAICIVLRTKNKAKQKLYRQALESHGHEVCLFKSSMAEVKEGKINIATMHAVKGRDFEAMFLADVSEESVPQRVDGREREFDAERKAGFPQERSLLYVALTRAKRAAYITAPGKLSKLVAETLGE